MGEDVVARCEGDKLDTTQGIAYGGLIVWVMQARAFFAQFTQLTVG